MFISSLFTIVPFLFVITFLFNVSEEAFSQLNLLSIILSFISAIIVVNTRNWIGDVYNCN